MIGHETFLLDPTTVKVIRNKRQRKKIEVESLRSSIRQHGQLQPIIVDRQTNELVAGERRLTAIIAEKMAFVKVWFSDQLNDLELRIIELEENSHREDLTWQERAEAIAEIHNNYCLLDADWTQTKTAEMLGYAHSGLISKYLSTMEELKAGNTKISEAKSLNQASNILVRKQDRILSSVMDELLHDEVDTASPPPKEQSIFVEDFNQWARTYMGPKFNFIHCDFPYGIEHQDTGQGNIAGFETYSDSQEVFWELVTTLTKEQDRLFSGSAHLMFWFDMAQYREVFKALNNLADFQLFPIPFVWHKTDNKGIISDAQRRARHIYEVAFFGSIGDRKIVQAISDTYGCPVVKEGHMSIKPEPMLRNFFRMFVDEHTNFLDPTCGSGSSLRAAESCGARSVRGLEKNGDFAEDAQRELSIFRSKRTLETAIMEKADA